MKPQRSPRPWTRDLLRAAAMLLVLGGCVDEQPMGPEPGAGLTRGSVYRIWAALTIANDPAFSRALDVDDQEGGVVDIIAEVGPMVTPPAPDADGIATAEVYSNETGETFWISAQAPTPWGLTSPDSTIGSEVQLRQAWRFRKDEPNASFRLVITDLLVEALDHNGTAATPDQCGWGWDAHLSEIVYVCDTLLSTNLSARYWAYADTTCCPDPFFSTAGSVGIHGYLNHLTPGVSVQAPWQNPLFDSSHFDFQPLNWIGQRHITVRLRSPITVDVPLDSLAVGDVFEVGGVFLAKVWTRRQGESYAAAYFRDPAGGDGLSLDFSGVTMIDPPTRVREPVWTTAPVLTCDATSGGAGGTIQFAAASYSWPEWPGDAAEIAVTRTGGSDGDASVAVATSGGTASPGSDYQEVSTFVRFADGETGTRVVAVPIVADRDVESDETVTLMLSDPRGCATLGGPSTTELTIMDDDGPPPDLAHTIGGMVSGLTGSGLVLTNLSTDDLNLTANGPFVFDREYPNGHVYQVRVDTQPTGQTCTISNGSGTVDGADVTDIEVTCEALPPTDGHLDPAFGTAGKVTLGVSSTGVFGDATDVALQDDGRIVVVGGNTLARYDINGTLDTGFGAGGVVEVDFYGGVNDVLRAVAIQPDGRIVVAGQTRDGVNSPVQEDFVVARYNPDGTLDTSFGTQGKVITDFESHGDGAYDVLIQNDGAIVVTGSAATIDAFGFGVYHSDFAAVRYTSTGDLDTSFGTDGKVTTNIGGDLDLGYAAALQPDGRILLVGRVAPSGGADPDFGVLRYNADGTLDTGFGVDGIVRNQTGVWDEAADVVVQPDGRIVVVGYTHVSNLVNPVPDTLTIERYNADGTYDASFGDNGRIMTAVLSPGRGVALQPDGGIVVVGAEQTGASADYGVARFDADGELDTSFGTDGLVKVDFFGDLDIANAVVVQPDGRIVVVGSVRNGANTQLGLVRVLP